MRKFIELEVKDGSKLVQIMIDVADISSAQQFKTGSIIIMKSGKRYATTNSYEEVAKIISEADQDK